jgi:hypothetical protein
MIGYNNDDDDELYIDLLSIKQYTLPQVGLEM